MMNAVDVSLVDALHDSIERIKNNFNRNWLIIGSQKKDGGLLSGEDKQHYEQYEMVVEPSYHSHTEICICVNGSCGLQLEDTIYEVDAGDVSIILPGVLHEELPKRDCDYVVIWVAFALDKIRLHLSGKSTAKNFFTVDGYSLKSDYEYNLMVNNVRAEIENNKRHGIEMVKAYVFQILVLILRRIRETKIQKSSSDVWKESVVSEVQKYIERNYSRHLRLEDISQEVCISINYLNTIFKSITKKTIMQYLEDLRIDKAKLLLKNKDDSIKNISHMLGYYDQYHFSKSFKKATGYSPTQFRKM